MILCGLVNSDPTLVTATLNNLSAIVKTRAPLAHKILSAVMSFNPLAIVAKANTVGNRLMMQCMEKTVRILLLNIARYADATLFATPFHPCIFIYVTGGFITDLEQCESKRTVHGQDFAAHSASFTGENRGARGAFAEEAGPATRDRSNKTYES